VARGHRVVSDCHFRLYPDLPGGLQRLSWGELAPCSPDEVDAHLHHVLPPSRVHHFDGVVRGRTGLARIWLPRLQQRYGPVLGTVILGTLHGLWHLPVFFTLVLGPFSFPYYVGFLIVAIAASFLYTWIFNHTKGSVLLATLTHGFGDAAGSLIALLIPAHLVVSGWAQPIVNGNWQGINVIPFGAFALLLIVFTRGRLGYQPERNAQLIDAHRPAEAPVAQL